jgi:hypothetical protein
VAPKAGNYVIAQGTALNRSHLRPYGAGREEAMNHAHSPAVDVTIGGQTRIYHAFITTAPVAFGGPSTLTLYESSFADVAGFAADAIPFDHDLGRQTARLVLIGSTELEWQRARYREGRYLLAQTDPVLVGLRTLQHWLLETASRHQFQARCTDGTPHTRPRNHDDGELPARGQA